MLISSDQGPFYSQLSRLSTVSNTLRRRRDDPDSDDERQHRSVDRRMNKEKPADVRADNKRNKRYNQLGLRSLYLTNKKRLLRRHLANWQRSYRERPNELATTL